MKQKEKTGIITTIAVIAIFFFLTSMLGTKYFFLWLIGETGNIVLLIILALIV